MEFINIYTMQKYVLLRDCKLRVNKNQIHYLFGHTLLNHINVFLLHFNYFSAI